MERAAQNKQAMEKKVIVITGATGGLGRQMVSHFEKRDDVQLALHTFEQEPFDVSCPHAWFKADLSNSIQVSSFISSVLANFKRVDIQINNAGITRNGMSWKLSEADFNQVMAVNVTAPFLLIRGFLPVMRENGFGRIVSISSVVAQTGVPGPVAYATSKAALLGMTKTIAKETATSGITINALALGYFDSGMIETVPEEQQRAIIEQIPKKRLGSTDTILTTLDWLISPAADYITGQTISLNGGLYTA